MVRVITVHHFVSQSIQAIEQPTACTVAPPNKLLLAQSTNCVEVRDLAADSIALFSFPTVDEVVQLLHCCNGNYVATVETKFNRQNRSVNFIRVYLNWNLMNNVPRPTRSDLGGGLKYDMSKIRPMRARIAGRVTPTVNHVGDNILEMIEVPVRRNPDMIACCQTSGNLCILSRQTVSIYAFQVKTHDISKMRFIDFEEMDLTIVLSFMPTQFVFCENYLACMNPESMYLCRLDDADEECERSPESSTNMSQQYDETKPIDFKKLIREEALHSSKGSRRITVNLPSIVRDNSVIHKNSPFTFTEWDMSAEVHTPHFGKRIKVTNLIQYKLVPIVVENVHRQLIEQFKSVILKPLYIDEEFHQNDLRHCDRTGLKSAYNGQLNGMVCMVATQQDGYLYHFNESEMCPNSDHCVAVYAFTAPIHHLVMEDYFLHALTETGLETYTLRFAHQLCRNIQTIGNNNVACPPLSDPICLVGLRPFINIRKMVLNHRNIILLAQSTDDDDDCRPCAGTLDWTIYNLELPSPKTVFSDISIVANVHRFSSPQTYCHLMNEAHMILRTSLLVRTITVSSDTGNAQNVRSFLRPNYDQSTLDTYRQSCALLADHYVMCQNEDDYSLAIPYYHMARLSPPDVIDRITKIHEQCENKSTKGLMYYLQRVLMETKMGPDADALFNTSSKHNVAHCLLQLMESNGYVDLPMLILKSRVLQEYSTSRCIEILENANFRSEVRSLALAVLYVHKGENMALAGGELKQQLNAIRPLLVENWPLLLQDDSRYTFSEFAAMLIDLDAHWLSLVLVELMLMRKMSLGRMIRLFLDFAPSNIGTTNHSKCIGALLQSTFENYFRQQASTHSLSAERGVADALKLLVRSYLSQLKMMQIHSTDMNAAAGWQHAQTTDDQDVILAQYRYAYLDKMPPFQVEVISQLYQSCMNDTGNNGIADDELKSRPLPSDNRSNAAMGKVVLKKLQAIMCSPYMNKHTMQEIQKFIELNGEEHEICGLLSLQTLLMDKSDVVSLLIEKCPQCLLQFGKDKFETPNDWKCLIYDTQQKILQMCDNKSLKPVCFFYKKLLRDTLMHVATTTTLNELCALFPEKPSTHDHHSQDDSLKSSNEQSLENGVREIYDYQPYIDVCKDTMLANEVNGIITTAAQQFLYNAYKSAC